MTDSDTLQTAHALRTRATERLRRVVGGEVMTYRICTDGGTPHYTSVVTSQGLAKAAKAWDGAPIPGGAASLNPNEAGWSVTNPLHVHHNRFALAFEDRDMEAVRTTKVWREFYGPTGIRDQARALLYLEGRFVAYIAATRGERRSFTRRDQEAANDIIAEITHDLQLAWSLAHDAADTTHVIVDERGRVLFASERARSWLTSRRLELLEWVVRTGELRLIDGMRPAKVRLRPGSLFHVSLVATPDLHRVSPAVLSGRQQSIATMAAKGLTNEEIGRLLSLSPRTIKYHLSQVYSALRIDGRSGLVRRGHGMLR